MTESAKQDKLDKQLLRMAMLWGMNSKAKRYKVGAIIVSPEGQIISDGYNGTISGFDNTCEVLVDGELKTVDTVLHAESNAIAKLAKLASATSRGATIYVTISPCIDCAKLIIQAGISKVVFSERYRNQRGSEILAHAGVQLKQIYSRDWYDKLLSETLQSETDEHERT